MLPDQNDRHQSAKSRPFEDLPHDLHDRSSLLCSLIVLNICSLFVLVKALLQVVLVELHWVPAAERPDCLARGLPLRLRPRRFRF